MSRFRQPSPANRFDTQNLRALLALSTPQEVTDGLRWYEVAHGIALHAGDAERGAGMLSALSPSLPWGRNVQAFYDVLAGRATKAQTGANLAKARRIMAGEPPLDVLGGPKTRSFYRNILDPSEGLSVTIDRHAYSALAGSSLSNSELGRLTVKPYQIAAGHYRELAAEQGLIPCQLQAILWLTHRRVKATPKERKEL